MAEFLMRNPMHHVRHANRQMSTLQCAVVAEMRARCSIAKYERHLILLMSNGKKFSGVYRVEVDYNVA